MIYLTLPVSNIDNSLCFYSTKLGMFDIIGGFRLVNNKNQPLIIDLKESLQHNEISLGICFEELSIIERLKEYDIKHKLVSNLSGTNLYIKDPDNHSIWITTQTGEIS